MGRSIETIKPEPWGHTGAILVGGRSRRMGRSKHDIPVAQGRTMLECVAAALSAICSPVVLAGTANPCPAGWLSIDDRRSEQGPLGGIEALLASGLDEQYLICPCDIPLVCVPLLSALTVPTTASATVLRLDGEPRPRPLPIRLSVAALPQVSRMLDDGRRAVHELLDALDLEIVAAPDSWMHDLKNVNTPEDLRRLCP